MTKNYLMQKSPAARAGKFAVALALAGVASLSIAGCNQNGGTSGPINVNPAKTDGGGGTVATVNGQANDRNALYAHMEANYGEASALSSTRHDAQPSRCPAVDVRRAPACRPSTKASSVSSSGQAWAAPSKEPTISMR